MKSGHGRLILRDGTDLPFDNEIVQPQYGSNCHGNVIGDTTAIDPDLFAESLSFVSEGGTTVMLMVTHHGHQHLTFMGQVVPNQGQSKSRPIGPLDPS